VGGEKERKASRNKKRRKLRKDETLVIFEEEKNGTAEIDRSGGGGKGIGQGGGIERVEAVTKVMCPH